MDAGGDTGPACEPTAELDLLFMVDSSGSLEQEQALLRAEIGPMMVRLAALGSLHVGFITSDLGAGPVPDGESVPSCAPGLGDDGILRQTSRGWGACETTYPSRIFRFGAGDDLDAFVSEVGCVADVGTAGCGFEQQLEATLKAISPASPRDYVASFYSPPTFSTGVPGHGDGANAGFLRPDSVLAIVLLTDEEDCSVPEYNIFYMNDPAYAGTPLNLRCFRFPESRYPVQRYVDGFLQLRETAGRLVYAPIVGVPSRLIGSSYETMLADPEMQEREDDSAMPPVRLVPSCSTTDGIAFAPPRMVEVALGLRDLGAVTTVQSICSSNLALDEIASTITSAMQCSR